MKIKFEKKYEDGTNWSVIVTDFLQYLSEKYGYEIDEYSMLRMVNSAKMDRLSEVAWGVKKGRGRAEEVNTKAAEMFSYFAQKDVEMWKLANELQKEWEQVAQAISPKEKGSGK